MKLSLGRQVHYNNPETGKVNVAMVTGGHTTIDTIHGPQQADITVFPGPGGPGITEVSGVMIHDDPHSFAGAAFIPPRV